MSTPATTFTGEELNRRFEQSASLSGRLRTPLELASTKMLEIARAACEIGRKGGTIADVEARIIKGQFHDKLEIHLRVGWKLAKPADLQPHVVIEVPNPPLYRPPYPSSLTPHARDTAPPPAL